MRIEGYSQCYYRKTEMERAKEKLKTHPTFRLYGRHITAQLRRSKAQIINLSDVTSSCPKVAPSHHLPTPSRLPPPPHSVFRYTRTANGSLVIRNLKISDTGMYQCTATNQAGEHTTYTWLRVKCTYHICV